MNWHYLKKTKLVYVCVPGLHLPALIFVVFLSFKISGITYFMKKLSTFYRCVLLLKYTDE